MRKVRKRQSGAKVSTRVQSQTKSLPGRRRVSIDQNRLAQQAKRVTRSSLHGHKAVMDRLKPAIGDALDRDLPLAVKNVEGMRLAT
jgi:hypothetical protein